MRNNIILSLQPIVQNINNIYNDLQSLNNDQLRARCEKLKRQISETDDQDRLDESLEECFAIVKETARRFSSGDVEVTANESDKKAASKFDFVDIEGDKAIYHNKWQAGGIEIRWGMIHYDTQIMAGILLHRGYAVEMATGEGKTLAVTLPAFLNGISHKGVHVHTANNYLSKRDCELTRPLYIFHGLTVDCIEYYWGKKDLKREAYLADICFGSNETFVFDYLYDNLTRSIDDMVQGNHNYCIIDELDSILIDRACTPHIIQGPIIKDRIQEFLFEIKDAVTDFCGLQDFSDYCIVNKKRREFSFTPLGVKWLENHLEKNGLFNLSEEDLTSENDEIRSQAIEKNYLFNAIILILEANFLYIRDEDYIVDKNEIIIINPTTGRLDYNCRWERGIHLAIEIKENVTCKSEHRPEGMISLGNYLKLYKKCCGMSGTIANVSEELHDSYGLLFASIPTYKPCIRKDNNIRVYQNKDLKYEAIIKTLQKCKKVKRPVLVSCISTLESDQLYDMISKRGIEAKKLNAKNLEKEAFIISKAGEAGSITISTAIAGRGTDIKLTNESRDLGGLLVISTCMFDSSRIDDQLKGRAGRQGDPGESLFFVSLDDTILHNLSSEERKTLRAEASKRKSLNIKTIRNQFFKAQKNKENEMLLIRKFIRERDDDFSRIRNQFYLFRHSVLEDSLKIYEELMTFAERCKIRHQCKKQLALLYKNIGIIMANAKNNHVKGKAGIIFSLGRELYSIPFDVDRTLESPEYFYQRFVQQIILDTYDFYWSLFIQEIQDNFSLKGNSLDERYKVYSSEANKNILIKLSRSCIPVNFPYNDAEEKIQQQQGKSTLKKGSDEMSSFIPWNAKCPCGSNKKYIECHGQRFKSKPLRRKKQLL